jgi:hypothetical protein
MNSVARASWLSAARRFIGLVALPCGVFMPGAAFAAPASAQAGYMLACQGCHLEDGRGFPQRGVPSLNGFVGNFLKVPGGREFLVQVPGAAQSELSDERLAEVLNWMLRKFSPAQLPAEFVPYTAAEVGRLRTAPLAEVAPVRARLLQRLDSVTTP